jgi:hypothetical protein
LCHECLTFNSLPLTDCGTLGGVAGEDICVMFSTHPTVDIKGIDNYYENDIDSGTDEGADQTKKRCVVALMYQYVLLTKGASNQPPGRLEWYQTEVNDKSVRFPGGL